MSDYNEEQAKYKALKRGIVEQRPVLGHKKKPKVEKPWHVMWNAPWKPPMKKPWAVGRFATKEQAEAYIEKRRRSIYVSRQNQSERAWQEARERAEEEAKRYFIEHHP